MDSKKRWQRRVNANLRRGSSLSQHLGEKSGFSPKFKRVALKSEKAGFLNLQKASKFNPSRNQHHSRARSASALLRMVATAAPPRLDGVIPPVGTAAPR